MSRVYLNRKVVKAKGGKRADLDGLYCRSAMEANFARVCVALEKRAVILEWEHEPRVFGFTDFGYKRGPWAYTPDYRILWNPRRLNSQSWADTIPGVRPKPKAVGGALFLSNPEEWFEVKGREVGSDRSKAKRMAKHYPEIKITQIGSTEYRHLTGFWKHLIPEWE